MSRVMGQAACAYEQPGAEPVHLALHRVREIPVKDPHFLSQLAPLLAFSPSLSPAGLSILLVSENMKNFGELLYFFFFLSIN